MDKPISSGTHRVLDFVSCKSLLVKDLRMEAGGIEPPSRDGFRSASTCVVGRLNLGWAGAGRQALAFPSLTVFSSRRGQVSRRGQPANRRLTG